VGLAVELAVLAAGAVAASGRGLRSLLVGGVLLAGVLLAGWWAWEHVPAFHARVARIGTSSTDSSNLFRMNVWRATAMLIQDNWLTGIGVGNDAFRHAYALYMVPGFEALGAYNVLLEWAAEGGILACLAFLWLLGTAMARAASLYRAGIARPWALGGVAGLLGLMAHGLVDTVFFRPAVQLEFWLLLALVCNLRRLPVVSRP
jgi:putative inorganic carbon (HCO3(-)) transporter